MDIQPSVPRKNSAEHLRKFRGWGDACKFLMFLPKWLQVFAWKLWECYKYVIMLDDKSGTAAYCDSAGA